MPRDYRPSFKSISRIELDDGGGGGGDNFYDYHHHDHHDHHRQFARNDEFFQSFHNKLKRLTDQTTEMAEHLQNMTDTINTMALSLQYLTNNLGLFMDGSSPSRMNSTTILIDDTSRSLQSIGNSMHTFNDTDVMINRNDSIEKIRQQLNDDDDNHESLFIEPQRSFIISDNEEEEQEQNIMNKSMDRSNYRFFRHKQNNDIYSKTKTTAIKTIIIIIINTSGE
ncbi:hypothetical protein DERF_015937 [Dermatophagoides farinae]|uniref:Uncharacterized protein n=1 Tax=Dermatophagoides farinae TaxID=6954 RepID=A0A922HFQ5_DERFA|nr:hypothetical protein DERF_015937 [Dermatophagoides farinae]